MPSSSSRPEPAPDVVPLEARYEFSHSHTSAVARLEIHTSHDPGRLLEAAAEAFLREPVGSSIFPSPPYWLFLRQGGIRDDLIERAAHRGIRGWFDPPIALFAEIAEILAEFPAPPVGDFERVVLVGRALRERAGPIFGGLDDVDAYADAADRWFGELVAEGIAPDSMVTALERRAAGRIEEPPGIRGSTESNGSGGTSDGSRGRGTVPGPFSARRDAELIAAYRRYLELLVEAGLRDPRARLIDCARAIRAQPEALAARLGGRRELRIFGLADPRGGWRALLEAFRSCPALDRVIVYTSEPFPFLEVLADRVTSLDPEEHFTARILTTEPIASGEPRARPAVEILSAPDLPREVEDIAVRVRELVESGTDPRRIAVIARSARPYAGHVLRALDRVGVPASARRRHRLREVPVVRALLALFRVAAEGWERHGLVELAETPYLRARLDASVLNHLGYQRRIRGLDAWRDAIAALADRAAARERRLADDPDDEDARRNPLPPHDRVLRALERFEGFARQAATLDAPRTIADWLRWLRRFADEDPWGLERMIYRAPGERLDTVRLDTAAWRGVRRILQEWTSAEERWGAGKRIGVAAFEARLRAMLSGDVALFTSHRRGVRVLEGLAASFRAFDHVFLLGLNSSNIPLRPPRSPLLDEHDRAEWRGGGIPIDTKAEWQEREAALFRNLLACAGASVTLSYARYDDMGAEQLPSPFLEEVREAWGLDVRRIDGSRAFTPGMPLAADPAALETAAVAATAELARAAGRVSPYHGAVRHPSMLEWLAEQTGEDRIWSPTQIEAFAKCPWAYFSGRLLRLEKLDDPELDIDPLTRGSVLHDALRRFYTAAAARTRDPVHLLPADLDWARPLAEASISAAVSELADAIWLGHPALTEQKLAELRRQLVAFVEWEASENERATTNRRTNAWKWVRTGVVDHEVAFDGVELEVDGERIRFRGFIDRVEHGIDPRGGADHLVAAVDYKTTIWSTPGKGQRQAWGDGVVLQVPLYAYALTRLIPGAEAARVEYRAVRNRSRAHELPLYRYDGDTLVADPEARAKYKEALAHVARHVRRIRSGEFAPDPPPSCNCPPFCHARDICRVPGGPMVR